MGPLAQHLYKAAAATSELQSTREEHSEKTTSNTIINRVFIPGFISKNFKLWCQLTNDRYILNIIRFGYDIEMSEIPQQYTSRTNNLSKVQTAHVNNEVNSLLKLGVVTKCLPCVGQFISPVFCVPKPDGSYRMILNLKQFNKSVEYNHFKMECLEHALQLLTPGCFMASVDLQKAYHSLLVAVNSRKFLRFNWNEQLYEYTVLPFGLSSAPRIFTKVLKVLLSTLREKMGITLVAYLDDTFIVNANYDQLLIQLKEMIELFEKAGFFVNFDKSVLIPCHRLKFLGFEIDSLSMKVFLPHAKLEKMISLFQEVYHAHQISIRKLSQVIGVMVSCFPAVPIAKLHYRTLEGQKIACLRAFHGDFNAEITLSAESNSELRWWIDNIRSVNGAPILRSPSAVELFTDASLQGWGAVLSSESIGGRWSETDLTLCQTNINALELLAVKLALYAFKSKLMGLHVKLRVDNTTAVSYVREFGGLHSSLCNKLAVDIWNFVLSNDMWLSISHIPGKENVEADRSSRHFDDNKEWKLNTQAFNKIVHEFGSPTIDVFATRLNAQCKKFISWKADPDSLDCDAFTIDWSILTKNNLLYMFPPFSLIMKVIQYLNFYRIQAIVVYPRWMGQPWYPKLVAMIVKGPIALELSPQLTLPGHPTLIHPMEDRLHLQAAMLDGNIL